MKGLITASLKHLRPEPEVTAASAGQKEKPAQHSKAQSPALCPCEEVSHFFTDAHSSPPAAVGARGLLAQAGRQETDRTLCPLRTPRAPAA